MCKVLIESGCDLTIADTTNKMAAHTAKKFNKMEVYEYLNTEYQNLKDQKKISAEQVLESAQIDEKKSKHKRKDASAASNGPKTQANTYRLYRADNFGNTMDVTYEELE